MVAFSPDPGVPYADFRQACRGFKPSQLVPSLAKASAALGEPPFTRRDQMRRPPWGLAAAARESLLYGNEHRNKVPDDRALTALMQKFQLAYDLPEAEVRSDDFALSLMTRLSYEQVPWQESMFEEMSRSHAWIVEGLSTVETNVITEDSIAEMLGGFTLRQAIGATFMLQIGVFINEGTYNPGWLDMPHFADVLDIYPRHTIETIAERLTTTVPQFRADYTARAMGTKATARFDYNPLVATPFVDLGHGLPVAPAAKLVLRTVTPGGLYYAGIQHHGPDFADDLGHLFEDYIGRQLRLIDGAEVHPEIHYGRGGGFASVDWFVVMPGLVLLVEVKSRRLGPAARTGGPPLMAALTATLQKARRQLGTTVENLAEGTAAFGHIPRDRPMLGLIVTAEPFYTGPAFLVDHDIAVIPGGSLPNVPVAAVSARTIEALVTHSADAEALLLDLLARRGDGVLDTREIQNKKGRKNPILAAAFDSYPWPSSVEDAAPTPPVTGP